MITVYVFRLGFRDWGIGSGDDYFSIPVVDDFFAERVFNFCTQNLNNVQGFNKNAERILY